VFKALTLVLELHEATHIYVHIVQYIMCSDDVKKHSKECAKKIIQQYIKHNIHLPQYGL